MLLRVELLLRILSHVVEQVARLERLAVRDHELFHFVHQFVSSVGIDPAERSSGERRESQTEYSADVTLQLQSRRPSLL